VGECHGRIFDGNTKLDYMNPLIQDKVQELRSQSEDEMDYLKRCYIFVNEEHLA